MYTKINRESLISEYLQFCSNFCLIENNALLPKTLHKPVNNYDEEYTDDNDINYDDFDMNDEKYENENVDIDKHDKINMASTLNIFKIFCMANLASVFPNLYYVLKLSVTLPVSSCSVERSFSKLKLIKTKLRNSIGQHRLEQLIKISCESDIEPNVENIINIMASKSSVLNKCLIY